jgi:hypothetical protein
MRFQLALLTIAALASAVYAQDVSASDVSDAADPIAAGAECVVTRVSRKLVQGNCDVDLVCDTRYGTKRKHGLCRPADSCSVRFQDCTTKGEYCAHVTDVDGAFWGACNEALDDDTACTRDFVCKSGFCKPNPDDELSNVCAKKEHKRRH